jgi:hypothetical protein
MLGCQILARFGLLALRCFVSSHLHLFYAGQEELKHLKYLCVALSLCVALCPIRLTTTHLHLFYNSQTPSKCGFCILLSTY